MSPAGTLYASPELRTPSSRPVTLLDLLDRLLAGGVVIHGQITLAAADIELVELDLSILLSSVDRLVAR